MFDKIPKRIILVHYDSIEPKWWILVTIMFKMTLMLLLCLVIYWCNAHEIRLREFWHVYMHSYSRESFWYANTSWKSPMTVLWIIDHGYMFKNCHFLSVSCYRVLGVLVPDKLVVCLELVSCFHDILSQAMFIRIQSVI